MACCKKGNYISQKPSTHWLPNPTCSCVCGDSIVHGGYHVQVIKVPSLGIPRQKRDISGFAGFCVGKEQGRHVLNHSESSLWRSMDPKVTRFGEAVCSQLLDCSPEALSHKPHLAECDSVEPNASESRGYGFMVYKSWV